VEPPKKGEFDWIPDLLASLNADGDKVFKTGTIKTCNIEPGDSDIKEGEVLPFVIDETKFPRVRTGRDCKGPATKVKFKFKKLPHKHIYEVTL